MRHRLLRKVFDGDQHSPTRTRTSSLLTFTKSNTTSNNTNDSSSNNNLVRIPHSNKSTMLHSKSTYFYHGDSSRKTSDSNASAQSFQRHPVSLSKSNPLRGRDFDPAQPGNDALWKNRTSAKLSSFSYVIPSMCGLALLAGLNLAISPAMNKVEQASATDSFITYGDTDGAPTISLETDGAANGTATVVEIGQTAYRENTLTVSGHDIDKYAVFINTAAGDNGELVGRKNPYATVGRVETRTKGSELQENTWGYAFTTNTNTDASTSGIANYDLYYNPVPTGDGDDKSVQLSWKDVSKTEGTFADTYRLVFAAKLGNAMPSDHYETSVYVSAVANAGFTTATGITNANGQSIYAMQDMTTDFCNAITEDAANITLYDKRDNKVYFVSRLKDGNCWMTQNLDYDIPAILDDKSDISGTSLIVDTKKVTITDWPSSGNTYDAYYDPGEYYYNGPNNTHSQNANSGCSVNGNTTLQECALFSKTGVDRHYLVGNYYSWSAATAGSGDYIETNGIKAPYSVCPMGWKLPLGNTSSTNPASFDGLMRAYSISGSNNIAMLYGKPLYFVYGGILAVSSLQNAGYAGYYWSSTAYSSSISYDLKFMDTVTSYGERDSRYRGFSIRCVFNIN